MCLARLVRYITEAWNLWFGSVSLCICHKIIVIVIVIWLLYRASISMGVLVDAVFLNTDILCKASSFHTT